jgi:hypothetical protein
VKKYVLELKQKKAHKKNEKAKQAGCVSGSDR